MKILVLGHKGMLGSMVMDYFNYQKYFNKKDYYDIRICTTRFGDKHFAEAINNFQADVIINCIGAIPQTSKTFQVNTDLPIWLSNNVTAKVVHPGTDCEMDADAYGTSKRIASDYIKLYSKNTKILKTSIVGPENGTANGLMAWLGAQTGTVKGYTGAIWNGNTTLEWCKQAEDLILNWDNYSTETILEAPPISKYDMLKLFQQYYGNDVVIEPVELGKNKCLRGTIKTKHLSEQLEDLKQFLII